MSITTTKWTINPETKMRTMVSKELSFEKFSSFNDMYFVVGRTNTGARYYSETVDSYNKAYDIFKQYKDMIAYFGGGEVQIFCIHEDGYDVVEFSRI